MAASPAKSSAVFGSIELLQGDHSDGHSSDQHGDTSDSQLAPVSVDWREWLRRGSSG